MFISIALDTNIRTHSLEPHQLKNSNYIRSVFIPSGAKKTVYNANPQNGTHTHTYTEYFAEFAEVKNVSRSFFPRNAHL